MCTEINNFLQPTNNDPTISRLLCHRFVSTHNPTVNNMWPPEPSLRHPLEGIYPQEPLMSGCTTFIDNWPEPIDKDGPCGVCLGKKIRTVLIQCGHTLCNPCLQEILAKDKAISKCPFGRRDVLEYMSLDSRRIRRPRDKSALLISQRYFEHPNDTDYVPPRSLINEPNGSQSSQSSQSVHPTQNTIVMSSSESTASQQSVRGQQILENQQSQRSRSSEQSQPFDFSLDSQPTNQHNLNSQALQSTVSVHRESQDETDPRPSTSTNAPREDQLAVMAPNDPRIRNHLGELLTGFLILK